MSGRQAGEATRVVFTLDSLRESGGLERVLTTRCNHLAADPELDVAIITLDAPSDEPFFALDPSVRLIALDIPLNRRRALYAPENVSHMLRYARALRGVLSTISPDVIVNCDHNYSTYLLPILKGRARIFHEHHSTDAWIARAGFRWLIREELRRFVERRYEKRIFLSQKEADAGGFANPAIVPNPVAAGRAGGALIEREKMILSAGRLASVKGFDRLIDAWSRIAAQWPEWRIAIFGDGSEEMREQLRDQARQMGIENSVVLAPATGRLDLEMRRASIYAMASRSEAFPMVLLEAMREGLPILSYDCPTGPRSIINPGRTGVLVSNGDADAFAAALSALIADAPRRNALAQAAQAEVERYSVHTICAQWKSWFVEQGSEDRRRIETARVPLRKSNHG